jgi:hypothetical protein
MSIAEIEALDSAANRSKDAMYAAYASLQLGDVETAKTMLRTGLLGGRVTEPQEVKHCQAEWNIRVASKVPRTA